MQTVNAHPPTRMHTHTHTHTNGLTSVWVEALPGLAAYTLLIARVQILPDSKKTL